ncbi:hypothetical protein AVEN_2212-1 [Araneus ventricosus]|uniref:Uncharacterized protein n=1 Tax=Araneus ventricosus TaxID=182803 RepID=A0A4Y2VB76_ARAVE|nr:hypothetical protein AVEN_2212-1 [Araneus ventricosus]
MAETWTTTCTNSTKAARKVYVHKIDDLLSAEFPNPERDPMLRGVIKTQIIHGPCGSINPQSPCMKEGKCTKRTACETFKQACELRGLLEDDPHCKSTLDEAATTHSARMLRDLFAVMLQTCSMSNPTELWNLHKENMAEDVLHETRIRNNSMYLTYTNEMLNKTLIALEDMIKALDGSNLKVFGHPEAQRDVNNSLNYEILRETSFDIQKLTSYIATNEPNLVDDQRFAFKKITSAFSRNWGIFLLGCPRLNR